MSESPFQFLGAQRLIDNIYMIVQFNNYSNTCSNLMLYRTSAGEEQLPQRGAFASQYVANHLVRDEPSSQPQETMGVNATKNLATLSKLFRQLKPQPLHSGTCNARTKLLVSC